MQQNTRTGGLPPMVWDNERIQEKLDAFPCKEQAVLESPKSQVKPSIAVRPNKKPRKKTSIELDERFFRMCKATKFEPDLRKSAEEILRDFGAFMDERVRVRNEERRKSWN